MRKVIVMMALLAVAGCKNPDGTTDTTRTLVGIGTMGLSEVAKEVHQTNTQGDIASCKAFGFKEGTKDFQNCALRLYEARLSRPVTYRSAPSSSNTKMHCKRTLMGDMDCTQQ